MQKVFNCPECRNSNYFESLEKIPKNIVLSNLVNNLNSNKAVCPECNTIDDLFSCDHCSHIFCRKCVDVKINLNLITHFFNFFPFKTSNYYISYKI